MPGTLVHIRTRSGLALAIALALPALPTLARAGQWSGSVAATSQYVSRGYQNTWHQPTLQAGAEYDFGNGITAGAWGSGVSELTYEGATAEVDLYMGYEKTVGDFTIGASAYEYLYPGARMSAVDESYNYAEVIPSVGWHDLTLSYAYTVSRDFNGYNSRTLGEDGDRHSRGSGYLDASLEIPVGKATRVQLHAGRQHIRNFSAYDWKDALVGVQHDLTPAWTVSAAYAHGWFKDGIYDEYTTGVPDRHGVVRTSNPLGPSWIFSVARNF